MKKKEVPFGSDRGYRTEGGFELWVKGVWPGSSLFWSHLWLRGDDGTAAGHYAEGRALHVGPFLIGYIWPRGKPSDPTYPD